MSLCPNSVKPCTVWDQQVLTDLAQILTEDFSKSQGCGSVVELLPRKPQWGAEGMAKQ